MYLWLSCNISLISSHTSYIMLGSVGRCQQSQTECHRSVRATSLTKTVNASKHYNPIYICLPGP